MKRMRPCFRGLALFQGVRGLVLFPVGFFFLWFVPVDVSAQPSNGEGLKAQITAVKIPESRRPVVTFRISDAKGNPLDRSTLEELRFTIAAVKTNERGETSLHNYVLLKSAGKDYLYKGETKRATLAESEQPTYDREGDFRRLGPGLYTYAFKTTLPLNYDRKATHIVGGELTRSARKYVVNPLLEFVPAGGKVKLRHAVVDTATCNTCHDPLKPHGGLRREVGYCALCHTSQLSDPETGETLDFKFMVHKIHRGKNLGSVKAGKPYLVVGNRQAVFDFSSVGFPQSLRNCKSCHASEDRWTKLPSETACTSCHDQVDLRTGKNHAAGPAPEGSCVGCHLPQGDEFGPSVAGAHADPYKSVKLPGIAFDILKIEGTKPGENPSVTFGLKNKKGEPVDAAKMDNLRLVLAWPTTDYRILVDEDARKAQPSGGGIYTYKFRYAVPSDATGSGAVGIQGYKVFDLQKPNGNLIKDIRDVGFNVVKYFSITDRVPAPRRTIVKTESCNGCHGTLALHGESRRATEYCVTCHTAHLTDEIKRKTAKGPAPPENVHFKTLIHKIHTGEELGGSFVVYGGPPAKPAPLDFSEVRYPGDRRNCGKCHEKGTYEIPLPAKVLPTATPQSDGSLKNVPPITAACTSCHTKEAAKAHVEIQTAAGGRESCVVCHASGKQFSVTKSHAR